MHFSSAATVCKETMFLVKGVPSSHWFKRHPTPNNTPVLWQQKHRKYIACSTALCDCLLKVFKKKFA